VEMDASITCPNEHVSSKPNERVEKHQVF